MATELLCDEALSAGVRFREAALRSGWTLESVSLRSGQVVRSTEDLDPADRIDVAISGASAEAPTLIVTSGLHGVEGLFGSAAQLAILDELSPALATKGIRVVLVHVLNPWGFVHRRRFDASNRDLNRNCLLKGEVHRGSPDLYEQLDPLINPSHWPRVDLFLLKAIRLIAHHGFNDLRRAIAQGQYEFPNGLFFGGRDAAVQQAFLSKWLLRWVGDSRRVVHVDFHTGLGGWKTWKLLPDGAIADHHQRELTDWLGKDTFAAAADQDGGYEARGGLGKWCASQLEVDYLYVCAEFGTYSGLRVLKAMRRENYCHQAVIAGRMEAGTRSWQAAKDELREVFFPADKNWRSWAVGEASRIVERLAIELVAEFQPD